MEKQLQKDKERERRGKKRKKNLLSGEAGVVVAVVPPRDKLGFVAQRKAVLWAISVTQQ